MHNINFIRENPIEFDNFMKLRGEQPCSKKILKIDKDKRNTQTVLQNLLAERNKLSKEVGILKSEKKDASILLNQFENIKKETLTLKELEKIKDEELSSILSRLPNLPSQTTPIGKDENQNVNYKNWGIKCLKNVTFLKKELNKIRNNKKLIGYGAAAKANTFLNFSKIKLDLIIDDNKIKQNKFCPGNKIPIKPISFLKQFKEDIYIIPLAWNFYNEIKKKVINLRKKNNDKFIVFYPKFRIY